MRLTGESGPLACAMVLSCAGGLRTLGAGGLTVAIRSQGAQVGLIALDRPLEVIIAAPTLPPGRRWLMVENPLAQNIVAILQGRPLVGLEEAIRAQRFLKRLHGWQGDDQVGFAGMRRPPENVPAH